MNTYEAIAQSMAMAVWDGPAAVAVQAIPPEEWMKMSVAAASRMRTIDEMTTIAHSLRDSPHPDPVIKMLVERWDKNGCAAVFSPDEMAKLREAGRNSPPF